MGNKTKKKGNGKGNGKDRGRPLNICLLSYRGNPTSGGQGVYIKYLSRALRDLGHHVEVIAGPPYPELVDGVAFHPLPGLDLYNPDHLFKVKDYRDLLTPLNQMEFLSMCSGGFPEPFTFGQRVYDYLLKKKPVYDIVHDNQCLAYGLLKLPRIGFPMVATIHHPITVDRDMELAAAPNWFKRLKVRRWYSFLRMQVKVSRRLSKIITVSECSKRDIGKEFGVSQDRFRVCPTASTRIISTPGWGGAQALPPARDQLRRYAPEGIEISSLGRERHPEDQAHPFDRHWQAQEGGDDRAPRG
jgi:glycosyltransferase involved in cell wall biosynthesis